MNNLSGFRFPRLVLGISFAWFFVIGSTAMAQRFNLEEYLIKKDVNKNGRIEPEELSDNAKNMLKKMGFDDSRSNSIKRIMGKVNNDRKEQADKSSSKSANTPARKVPGFGVENKEAAAGVTRFGASATGTGGRGKNAAKFSDSVNERVQSTLDRYDKNKDGSLDKKELSDARWGSPPPEQNDTNRDGRLSRDELAVRYQSREQQYQKARSSSRPTSTKSNPTRSNSRDSDRRSRDRESFRSSGGSSSTSSNRSRSSSPSRTSTSSSSGSSPEASRAKYEKYAESLVSQYDTDKDGKLSSDETKKMRRPPAGADADKDGFITKDELVGSLSNTSKPSTPAAKSDSKASDSGRSRSPRSRESSGSESRPSSRGGSSSSFDSLDENADRQIQMHEFSKKWDDKTVDEFYEKDKNGDGVITSQEWSGK